MRRGSISPAVGLWGVFLATLTAVMVLFFEITDPEPPALLGGGAALAIAVAGTVAAARLGTPDTGPRAVPDSSPPTVWLAIAIAMLSLSVVLGFWLTLIAAGMCGIGIGALARELRSQSRASAEERS